MSQPANNVVRVEFSTVEDCRRVIFSVLEGVEDRKRARLASLATARLRDAGLIGQTLEQHYSPAQLAALFPRGPRYWTDRAKTGDLGQSWCDGRGWMIPASGVLSHLAEVASPAKKGAAEMGEIARENVFQRRGTVGHFVGSAVAGLLIALMPHQFESESNTLSINEMPYFVSPVMRSSRLTYDYQAGGGEGGGGGLSAGRCDGIPMGSSERGLLTKGV